MNLGSILGSTLGSTTITINLDSRLGLGSTKVVREKNNKKTTQFPKWLFLYTLRVAEEGLEPPTRGL